MQMYKYGEIWTYMFNRYWIRGSRVAKHSLRFIKNFKIRAKVTKSDCVLYVNRL